MSNRTTIWLAVAAIIAIWLAWKIGKQQAILNIAKEIRQRPTEFSTE